MLLPRATNYLPNVLMQMEAKEAGLDNGVFIDDEGYVGESSNMNVAFVTRDGVFRHPRFEHILSGVHVAAPARARAGLAGAGSSLQASRSCDIPVADARAAREMMLIGSSVKVAPIVEWDKSADHTTESRVR